MKDWVEIVRRKIYGRVIFQVNVINGMTGKYYNSRSLFFDSAEEAIAFAEYNNYNIKKIGF